MSGNTTDQAEWRRIGATVRQMREMRGMTPDQLASKILISRAYLSNIEAGRKRLTPILLARVAEALAVPQIAIALADPEVAA